MKRHGANLPFLAALALGCGIPGLASADTACVDAPMQLQQYIAQVNQTANFWYYQGIAQQCGYNQYCQAAMFQQLNFWYQQQSGLVNQWYYRISTSCTQNSQADRNHFSDTTAGDRMNENDTDDLDVDQDENKTVAIVIPDTPSGFHGH